MDVTTEEFHKKVKRVTTVMVEVGADLIKPFYTGDKLSEIMENAPVSIFITGAENPEKLIKSLYDAINKNMSPEDAAPKYCFS